MKIDQSVSVSFYESYDDRIDQSLNLKLVFLDLSTIKNIQGRSTSQTMSASVFSSLPNHLIMRIIKEAEDSRRSKESMDKVVSKLLDLAHTPDWEGKPIGVLTPVDCDCCFDPEGPRFYHLFEKKLPDLGDYCEDEIDDEWERHETEDPAMPEYWGRNWAKIYQLCSSDTDNLRKVDWSKI